MVKSQHFINKVHSRPITPLKQTEVQSCKCHGPGKNDKHAEPLVPEEASPIFVFGHQSKFGVKNAHRSQTPQACESMHSSPFKRIIDVPNAAYPAEKAVQETRNETNNEGCPRFAAITNARNRHTARYKSVAETERVQLAIRLVSAHEVRLKNGRCKCAASTA